MATITATYADGRVLIWRDGEIEGAPSLVISADRVQRHVEFVQPMPEASSVRAADYKTNQQAFVGVARLAHPADSNPRIDFPADYAGPTPPPADAN